MVDPLDAPTGALRLSPPSAPLTAKRLRIHTQAEAIVFMRADSPVSRAEGLAPTSRVLLRAGRREVLATLYQVSDDLVGADEVGLSEIAWERLQLSDGQTLQVLHPNPIRSESDLRRRIYGNRLDENAMRAIVSDIAVGRYSEIHISAFLTACAALPLDEAETVSLTRIMVEVGERLVWPNGPIVDKHSVGGLPGNRTTPIIVPIVAAHGLTMPKTSSRAITSPAGTADAMETLAPVDLDLPHLRRVVEQEGGCIVWGGAMRLSPADDVLIRVERVLDLDSEGQLVASVLSKKIAAGSNLVVLDMPVGPTAKVRSPAAAAALSERLTAVGRAFGVTVRVVVTDGSEPVGRGIGPALEARDVLAVLQGKTDAPPDLRQRSCRLAGAVLEMGGVAKAGEGAALAAATIADGRAWAKFQRICEAQGGQRTPPQSSHRHPLASPARGRLAAIDNRKIARLAKLAGAPDDKAAGVALHIKVGQTVGAGEPLCTVHAESRGELDYALEFAAANPDIFALARD